MFILFAFIALSAAEDPKVEYNKAKYLITKEGKADRQVLVLNTCAITNSPQTRVKYEPVSNEKYKALEYPATNTKCEGTPTSSTEHTLGTQGEDFVYADKLPTHMAYSTIASVAGCSALVENIFTIYNDVCSTKTVHTGAQSEKMVKEGNSLRKKYFTDTTCTSVLGTGVESYSEIGDCGKCDESGDEHVLVKCEVKTEGTTPNTPSGGNTNPTNTPSTAKYAVDKLKRVEKGVLELKKCSKSTDNKYMKAVSTSSTKYKICTYTDDKCTAGETCQPEAEDMEFVNELPKHIGYSVLSADAQCATLTDASFTIYVEGCIETNVVTGGNYEKGVIEGGKFKIKSYSDNKCTTLNSNTNQQERDVQECGKCNGSSQRSAMKCQAYGSSTGGNTNKNGSIQTFVLFALTILMFFF